MFKLLLISFVLGEVQEYQTPFESFDECVAEMRAINERHEMPVGVGMACVRVPAPDERDA